MKRLILLILIIVMACGTVWGGNSILSFHGMPVRYYGNDIYGLSMGDTGMADNFRYNSGFGNPALHNASNRTLLATGLLFGFTKYASGNGEKFVDDALDLPYLSLSMPIKKHRIGFQVNSHSSGLVKNFKSFTTADSLNIKERHIMDRYIYKGDLIYSYRMGRYSAGASLNYYFGHDVRTFDQIVKKASQRFYSPGEGIARSYKGPSFTLGAMANYDRFSAAMYYRPNVTLKGFSRRHVIYSTADNMNNRDPDYVPSRDVYEEPEADYEYELPWEVGLGTSILPFKEHKLNVDLHYEAWNQLDNKLQDGIKLGVGWAYEPVAETRDSYLSKLPLRAGFSWRALPFKVNDEPVAEYAVSCGVSFPLKRDINRLDLGFQMLKRGNLDTNKLSDTSFMFMLGFTGFDIIGKAGDRTAPREIPVKEEMNQW
ncbi:MAG: hypothetical protein ACOYIS_01100 [Candidatus Cloacimonadaceae bacterium]|jgi:hypothetical protein